MREGARGRARRPASTRAATGAKYWPNFKPALMWTFCPRRNAADDDVLNMQRLGGLILAVPRTCV